MLRRKSLRYSQYICLMQLWEVGELTVAVLRAPCSMLLRRLWPEELARIDTAKPSMMRERHDSNVAVRYRYHLIDIAIKFQKDLLGQSKLTLVCVCVCQTVGMLLYYHSAIHWGNN